MLRSAESVSLLITAVSASMLTLAVFTAQPLTFDNGPAPIQELDVASGLPLSRVVNPDRTLATLRVETSKGEKIGEVGAVKMGRDGIEAVTVKTRAQFGGGSVTTTIRAEDLVYMRGRNTLVSRLTRSELATQGRKPKKARL
jgi:hypothetical protein